MLVTRGILASAVLAAVAGIGVVPVFEAGETRRIEDCAANATVLFTCVDARFALNARRLAESVRAVGEFPAVLAVVQTPQGQRLLVLRWSWRRSLSAWVATPG